MLQRDFLRRLKPHALFWGVYTVVFLLFRAALPFTLPFLAGLLLAVLLRPLRRLLQSRLRLRPGGLCNGVGLSDLLRPSVLALILACH